MKTAPAKHPYETAPFFSWLFFWWTNDLMTLGRGHNTSPDTETRNINNDAGLTIDMMPHPPLDDQSRLLYTKLSQAWDHEVRTKGLDKARFYRAVMRCFGWHYMKYGVMVFTEGSLMMFVPFCLARIVRAMSAPDEYSLDERLGWAGGLVGANCCFAVLHHHLFFGLNRFGGRLRTAIQALLYKKTSQLSAQALTELTTGTLLNVMGSDLMRVEESIIFLHFVWVAVLVSGLCLYVMYSYVEYAALAGFLTVVLLIPIQSFTNFAFGKLRSKIVMYKDRRVKHVNEIVTAVRLVKMYTWEKAFAAIVNVLRLQEISTIANANYLGASNYAFGFTTPLLIALITFVTYDQIGGDLTPEKVYGTLAFVYPTRQMVAWFLPFGVRGYVELKVIFGRIESVLKGDEKPQVAHHSGLTTGVYLSGASMTWKEDATATQKDTSGNASGGGGTGFQLTNVAFTVTSGQVLGVIGKVGAGKSTLLHLLLGEIKHSSGTVNVNGTCAYASQVPWILTDSVRNNILFGRPYDPAWYKSVVRACALSRDFQLWPHRDDTYIGERGVTLSGGQRARISLARAIYGKEDIVLLDDPLSAVDVVVGRHIFQHVVLELLKDKAVILVTHQQQYLREVTNILVLDNGSVRSYGNYDTIASQLHEELKDMAQEEDETETATITNTGVGNENEDIPLTQPGENGPKQEDRTTGAVTWKTYKEYLSYSLGQSKRTVLLVLVWVLAVFTPQALYLVTDWWLSKWSDTPVKDRSGNYYVTVYGLLVAGTAVFAFARSLFITNRMTKAARLMHDSMFQGLLSAPTLFFDQTPGGRILNRFSQDLGVVDEQFVNVIVDLLSGVAITMGTVALVCALNPWLFLPVFPIVVSFFFIRRYYVQTIREVKRLQSTTRSPIISHLTETLHGIFTLRSFNAQDRFFEKLFDYQDDHTKPNYMFLMASRWLGMRLDLLCILFLVVTVFFGVTAVGDIPSGAVGVSLLYVVQLLGGLQWFVRQSAEAEALMISVERVLEFTHLPVESARVTPADNALPPLWPKHGKLEFQGASLKYVQDGAYVLKDISLTIPPGSKVGVVGRTGAGKSSLIAALFRLTELCEGKILIDGIDCKTLGLERLRSTFCVIPQEPLLFTATIQENIDPFTQYKEQDIWRVLKLSELSDYVESLEGGLKFKITEGGGNFSVGQRQLLCLARALLHDAKILIMDEATANVDYHTDGIIQKCIRQCFEKCTVITVAHRLDTIIDCDYIMVLDGGRLKEFDSPHLLLQDRGTIFSSLVDETGPQHSTRLRGIALASSSPDVKALPPAESNATTNPQHSLTPQNLMSLGVEVEKQLPMSKPETPPPPPQNATTITPRRDVQEPIEEEDNRIAYI
eukprot:PhF_6_TR10440/c0_g1_i2/m.16510/K05673/ABCC4; ATP-binding cassette, subfamily C (CFTR/MRP), member 4